MSAEENKVLVRRFVREVIGNGNVTVADELIAPAYVYHGPGMDVRGPEGIKHVFLMLRTAFPDWSETIEHLIAEGDRVVFRVTGHGTHQGDFQGIPPTGKQVAMMGIDIVRITGSRMVEHWASFDRFMPPFGETLWIMFRCFSASACATRVGSKRNTPTLAPSHPDSPKAGMNPLTNWA